MRSIVDADVIGINNRDLGDLSVDVERTNELITDVPAGKTVSSSWVVSIETLRSPRSRLLIPITSASS